MGMVQKPVTEIVEEVKEVPRTVISPRTVVETVVESKSVPRTEMRAEERVEVVSVPRTRETMRQVEKTVMDTVHEQRQVPRTTMVAKCVQDRFEETKVLQFDPQTGTQLAGVTA